MKRLLLAVLALAGCEAEAWDEEGGDYEITCQMDCDTELQVSFDRALETEGKWLIYASFGEGTATCTLLLPTELARSGACDNEDMHLVVEDSAALRGLTIDRWDLGEVSLAVSFEGEELYNGTFEPGYTPAPEGGCGCAQIDGVTVSVPSPEVDSAQDGG